jgi:hypothetical protein
MVGDIMPFSISWYVPDRVILVELSGVLTTTEIQTFTAQSYEMIAAGKPLVHFITDSQQIRKIESIPEALKAVQASPNHENGGWYIMVGSINPFVNFASDFVSSIMRSRYRRFDTMQEALDFIKERDESLVSIMPPYQVVQPK